MRFCATRECRDEQASQTLMHLIQVYIVITVPFIQCTSRYNWVTVNSKIFARFFLANSVMIHICHIKNSRIWHDLHLLVTDEVLCHFARVYFHDTLHPRSFAKINIRENFRIYSNGLMCTLLFFLQQKKCQYTGDEQNQIKMYKQLIKTILLDLS